MIVVGIDDTDTKSAPGTNTVARGLVSELPARYRITLIVRHQLLRDPRVPYTSKNSAAALLAEPMPPAGDLADVGDLVDALRNGLSRAFVRGSDPGLCVALEVPDAVRAFGRRCQEQVVSQAEARSLAVAHGIHLEGLGGSHDGVIGALAAVGLAASGSDGRVVGIGGWPDDLTGAVPVQAVLDRQVEVREIDTGDAVADGVVDLGKRLRPSYRGGRVILFVSASGEPDAATRWTARRLD